MKLLVFCATFVVYSAAISIESKLSSFSVDKFVNEINEKATTWVAAKNFEDHHYEKLRRWVSGVRIDEDESVNELKVIRNPHNESEEVPESFDAREKWPLCESLTEIRDQSQCGSCWAVAATSAMSDRICIHSNQTKQTRVSTEDLLSCSDGCGDCYNGSPYAGWFWWNQNGIVTGGLYKSNQGCKDYTLQPCEHYTNGSRPQCDSLKYDTPTCVKQCQNSSLDYEQSMTYGQDVYYFESDKQIMLEVSKNGPVSVFFTVYTDFLYYKSGVYQPTVGTSEGNHAVKVIGWGVENGVKYWLIPNSWNSNWGDNGYFKILRGVDCCGIENRGTGSLPK